MRYEVEVKFHKSFIEVNGNQILLGLTSKPERGKANRELLLKLAKHFQVPTSHIKIVSGLKAKTKIVDVL
jgi:uncharacterized protein YggU (UPF0235/DUF167 family)